MKHLRTQIARLYTMMLIRAFENKISEAFAYGKLAGSMFHLSIGQEATSVGTIAALKEGDLIQSHHRGHGHMIALGADISKMMAEMFGRVDGYCKGKGGSMHIADIELGNLGANGIVGAGLPIATGAALGIRRLGTDQIVMCFLGDGASLEGEFHESLNFAAVQKLPIIYVIENNQYALSTSIRRSSAIENLSIRSSAYGMPGRRVDGMQIEIVFDAARKAVGHVRSGKGPYLLECVTYRYCGHSRSDPGLYRTKQEEDSWKERDPIAAYQRTLIEIGVATQEEYEKMEAQIDHLMSEAVEYANLSPFPAIDEIYKDIYVE